MSKDFGFFVISVTSLSQVANEVVCKIFCSDSKLQLPVTACKSSNEYCFIIGL